ncbi:MAG: competence/damage-inducible protein A [Candidatus Angelobacter sp. Gp1-AA117]|nr:MAG: competence/damage-inducible protein A [Candidatus Angelobacter sp. Gp1-AA117]
MNAEIIAIGSELLTPFRQDTNSLHLTAKLNELGVEVDFKTVVGDRKPDLVGAARIAFSRAHIIIFMGGLGPTEDDLTREAVAEALGLELKRDPEIGAALFAFFASRKVKMPENNLRQADVIAGAEVLKNPRGTAPGQFLETQYEGRQRLIMLLPGPPREILPMFDQQCMERLNARVLAHHIATRVLKIAMIGESDADRRAAPIYTQHTDVQTTILASTGGEVQLHLRTQAPTQEEAQERVDSLASLLEDEFDEAMFSTRGESLEQIVGYYLQMRGATLAAAESCTGGMLSERITSVAGSSRYFLGGAVVYDNSLKTSMADVPPLMIAEHGAVSREVATALAEGIRKRCKATLGVGITGIAGPGGGTEQKPVGLVFHAVSDGTTTDVVERRFPGDRDRVRHWASQQALDMIRRKLM